MSKGGARKGAGRKKSGIVKKVRGFRLTDQEWAFMKKSLSEFRKGNKNNIENVINVEDAGERAGIVKHHRQGGIFNNELGAGLLAHLENLYKQQYGWLLEYREYLKDENYNKYSLDEIKLHQQIVNLQILTLVPHLQKLSFSAEVKLACSHLDVSIINPIDISETRKDSDILIKPWKGVEKAPVMDYDKVNGSLAYTFENLRLLQLEVKGLEKQLHQYDW